MGRVFEDDWRLRPTFAALDNVFQLLLREGKLRRRGIVRRLFETMGYEVPKLDRSVYASLDKKDLPRGNWRFLTEKALIKLKYF